jgi:hypothetical protein
MQKILRTTDYTYTVVIVFHESTSLSHMNPWNLGFMPTDW